MLGSARFPTVPFHSPSSNPVPCTHSAIAVRPDTNSGEKTRQVGNPKSLEMTAAIMPRRLVAFPHLLSRTYE